MEKELNKAIELYWRAVKYYPVSVQPNELMMSLCQIAMQESQNHEHYLQQNSDEHQMMLLQPHQTWIIMQYAIEVEYYPENSHWQVEMNIVEANRFFITRKFTFTQNEGTKPFATCRVRFAAMDYHTRKIVSLPVHRINAFQWIETDHFEWKQLNPVADFPKGLCMESNVMEEDIDRNQHVNNLVYVKKGIQQLLEQNANIQLKSMQVLYRNELQIRDRYVILTQPILQAANYQQWFINANTEKIACYIYYQVKEGSDC